MMDHYLRKGGDAKWGSVENYTAEAQKLYYDHEGGLVRGNWALKDGTMGVKVNANGYYGIYDASGKIVSFGVDTSHIVP